MIEMTSYRIALVGGRGYTGAEFLALLASHPLWAALLQAKIDAISNLG